MTEPLIIDWTRRRVLRLADEAAPRCCCHRSRLTEWCSDCRDDLAAYAADLTA